MKKRSAQASSRQLELFPHENVFTFVAKSPYIRDQHVCNDIINEVELLRRVNRYLDDRLSELPDYCWVL